MSAPAHFMGLTGAATLNTRYFQLTRRAVADLVTHQATGVIYGPAGPGKTFAVTATVAALTNAAGRVHPPGAQEAAVLATLPGFGPAPRGADWGAGAEGLADAGLTAVSVEGELTADPAVRFSLPPEHSPSAQEETEDEY